MIIGGLILFVIVFVIAWSLSEAARPFDRLFNSLGWAGAVSAGLFGFVFGGFWGLVIGAFLGFAYAAGSVIAIPMLAAAAVYFAVFMGIVWVGVLVVQGGAGLLGVDSIWVVMTLVGIGFVYLLLFSPVSGTDRESIVDKIFRLMELRKPAAAESDSDAPTSPDALDEEEYWEVFGEEYWEDFEPEMCELCGEREAAWIGTFTHGRTELACDRCFEERVERG